MLTRGLHLAHRWLGVVLGGVVLLWLLSGLVMLFVARPQLTEAERLAGLPALRAGEVRLAPLAAWQALGRADWPEAVRLDAGSGRPVYHFLVDRRWVGVHADDGSVIPAVGAAQAMETAQRFAGGGTIEAVTALERDQWTVYRRFDAWRPFYRVELADGRDIYVAQGNGEVALDTSRSERLWNWLGSVVHWVYFTPLREHTTVWRNLVLWGTVGALLLAVSGCWLGWQRARWRQPYAGGRWTPYRAGWKRWHHVAGLAGGLFLVTWLFSGWLSMAPFGLASGAGVDRADALRLAGGALSPSVLGRLPVFASGTRQVEWLRFAGAPLLRQSDANGTSRLQVGTGPWRAALSPDEIRAAAVALRPGERLAELSWLTGADEHYYPLRHHPRRFPVVRVRFDDAPASVFYIAPESGRIVHYTDRRDGAHRWLFHALHRFDVGPLIARPMLRDGLIIVLSLLGCGVSLAGLVLGWHRLIRHRAGA